MAHLGESGVDENAAIILGYESGALTTICTAIRTSTPHQAVINGALGRITMHPPYWFPQRITLEVHGGETSVMDIPMNGNGFNHEAPRWRAASGPVSWRATSCRWKSLWN